MARILERLLRKAGHTCFWYYYYAKAKVLGFVLGSDALAYVLHDSLFPDIVLRMGGAKIGKNTRIHRWLVLHETRGTFENLVIGDDVFLGKNVTIDLTAKVEIGNRCAVGMNVKIITHSNFGDSVLSSTYPPEAEAVEIMDDSVINWGCIVLKGSRIMPKTILLPASVVGGVAREGSVYGGNPARLIPQKAVA